MIDAAEGLRSAQQQRDMDCRVIAADLRATGAVATLPASARQARYAG
jgi:hypothetical protein